MTIDSFRTMRSLMACLAILVGLVGCGRSDGLLTIRGTVTFDGQPVEEGSISLMPVDGRGVTGGGLISKGSYSAETSPGEMAVQIYAYKTVVKENPSQEEIERGLTADRMEVLPPVYNRQSKLRITVSDAQKNFDFDLNSAGDVPPGLAASQ
jgi:hypothetical protein